MNNAVFCTAVYLRSESNKTAFAGKWKHKLRSMQN